MHLYALCPKVELVAVIIEEAQKAVTEILGLLVVLEIADNETDDGEASDTACMNLVHATHNEELLQQSDHVYHIGVIVLPLLKRCLSLDSAEVLEGNIHVDVSHSIHELNNWHLGLGDAQHVRGDAYSFKPSGSLPQRRVDNAFVAEVHSCWTTLVEPVGGVYQVHICSRQVQPGRKGAEAENAPSILRESLSAQSLLYSLDKSMADIVLIWLRRYEVVEVENFVV